MVEVRLPRQHDLAVCKQTQLPAIINEAFGAIEKQLKLFQDAGYGFICTVDGNRQFYFHRNSVLHDDFASPSVGTEVRFSPEEGEQGPQASSVQILAKLRDGCTVAVQSVTMAQAYGLRAATC